MKKIHTCVALAALSNYGRAFHENSNKIKTVLRLFTIQLVWIRGRQAYCNASRPPKQIADKIVSKLSTWKVLNPLKNSIKILKTKAINALSYAYLVVSGRSYDSNQTDVPIRFRFRRRPTVIKFRFFFCLSAKSKPFWVMLIRWLVHILVTNSLLQINVF